MSVRPVVIALLLSATAVSACGKAGGLERPGPLFGPTRAGAQPPAEGQDPTRPVRTVDPRRGVDDATNPAPSRSLPIEGQNPTPFDAGPPGTLPNPGVNPQ